MNEEGSKPISPSSIEKQAPVDARALVGQMLQVGVWTPPEVMQQIVDAGDAAIEPLVEVLHSNPQDWKGMNCVGLAVGLLSVLRRPETIPEVVKIVEEYDDEVCLDAAESLASFGPPGFDALVSLLSSPSIKGYQKGFVADAAAQAALDDPTRSSRVSESLRSVLDEVMVRAREELKTKGFLAKHPLHNDWDEGDNDVDDEFDEPDDDVMAGTLAGVEDEPADETEEAPLTTEADSEEYEWDPYEEENDDDGLTIEPFTAEEVGMVVSALAKIADPLARDTIMKAFAEGLVDEAIVTRKDVLEHYDGAKAPTPEDRDHNWLDAYREDYAARIKMRRTPPPTLTAPLSKYRYEDRYDEGDPPPGVPVTEPIRRTGPKLGRNDPCWCGSGKKYKKCHLGKETTT